MIRIRSGGSGRRSRDWLALGEASRLLGVAPGTLRRWTNTGDIASFTTPGGHRRYRLSVIERMIRAREAAARPALLRSGLSTARLTREYRHAARLARRDLPWLVALTPEQIDWFRVRGRRLAELLLRHLDAQAAAIGEPAPADLAEASAEAGEYGRMASDLGLSLGQTVEGFLQFRRPFLHQLGVFAAQRALDTAMTTGLVEAAERALDQLLIATMAAHNVERVRSDARHAGDGETEGVR